MTSDAAVQGTYSEYKIYHFTAVATEPTVGNTISATTGYTWNFGDGTILNNAPAQVTHAFSRTGSFLLGVVATDNQNNSSTQFSQQETVGTGSNPFLISLVAPSGVLPRSVPTGSSVNVTFDFIITLGASSGFSYDLSGITFATNDTLADTVVTPLALKPGTTNEWTVTMGFPAAAATGPRTFTPTVQVIDTTHVIQSDLQAYQLVTITTTPTTALPPVVTLATAAQIPVAGDSFATWQNVPVTFTATATDPASLPLTYTWTFGDTAGAGDLANSAELAPTHAYAAPGLYPVTFTATNGVPGGTTSTSLVIDVMANAAAPSVAVTQTPSGHPYAYQAIAFTAAATDPDGDALTYTWNFGDGSAPVTGASVTHTWTAVGSTAASVTADDGKGGIKISTLQMVIQASLPPVAAVTTVPVAGVPLLQSKSYTFAATATDLNAGGSITQFVWNFGDGTPLVTSAPSGSGLTATTSVAHSFSSSFTGTAAVQVSAVDAHLSQGPFSPAVNFTVAATQLPTSVFSTPAAATSYFVETGAGSTVTVNYLVTATNPNNATSLAVTVYPLGAGTPGTLVAATSLGNNVYGAAYAYPAASGPGTTSYTPAVQVVDSFGIVGALTLAPQVTIQTIAPSPSPSIVVTSLASTKTYAMETPAVAFVLTDPVVNPVTYTIQWGDGSADTTGIVADASLTTGAAVSQGHQFLAAGSFTVKISAQDTRSAHQTATPQTVQFLVLANALPQAQITAPLASGTLGFTAGQVAAIYPAGMSSHLTVPASAGYPIVVIPEGGSLIFSGTGTKTTSGEALASTTWTFPYGVPSASASAGPVQATFAGVPGQRVAYLATFQTTDVFGRASAPANMWVVVDGVNTENFTLNLQYRQLGDDGATVSLNPVVLPGNGLNTQLEIHQDGYANAYILNSAGQASVTVPVRSNVPFYAMLPAIGSDPITYAVRIPCQPTASSATNPSGIDPQLENYQGFALSPRSSSFFFQSATAPWNPTLNVVTAQGFAPETATQVLKMLSGTTGSGMNPPTKAQGAAFPHDDRWLVLPSETAINYPIAWADLIVNGFSGVAINQTFAEWPLFMLAVEADKIPTLLGLGAADTTYVTNPTPSDLGFNLSFATYSNDPGVVSPVPPPSRISSVERMEAYRVPSNSTDPYDLSKGVANWDELNFISDLNPSRLHQAAPATLTYWNQLLSSPAASGTAFNGGLYQLSIPYDLNDPNRLPLSSPLIMNDREAVPVFSYAEYLWSTVWLQPVVLNSANLNTTDTYAIATTDWLLQSQPAAWPKLNSLSANPTPIEPDGSYFDLTANGAGFFHADSPVTIGTAATTGNAPLPPTFNPPSSGVGHFYWTAFTPSFTSGGAGALITRTWLAKGLGTQAPPVAADLNGSADTDASSGWGFVPAQDTMVDKRLRNPDGGLAGPATGGYRVTWFNATRSPNGNVVPPDFWVVELQNGNTGAPVHFMVPSNYPAQPGFPDPAVVTADATQTLSSPILTDARWFIAPPAVAGQPDTYSAAWTDKALVAPGYCWFDVPAELRPSGSATLTVWAVKAILQNQPPSAAHPRPLNRPDWLDGIKTAVANMQVKPRDGVDKAYAHKIPFNFPWDIVVANSEPTPVEPTTAP